MPPTDTETAEAQALPHIPGFVLLTGRNGPIFIRVSDIHAFEPFGKETQITVALSKDGDWLEWRSKDTVFEVAAAIARATTGEPV